MFAHSTVLASRPRGVVAVAVLFFAFSAAHGQFVTLLPSPMSDSLAKDLRKRGLHFDSLRASVAAVAKGTCAHDHPNAPPAQKRCEKQVNTYKEALKLLQSEAQAWQQIYCDSLIRGGVPDSLPPRRAACRDGMDTIAVERHLAGLRFLTTDVLFPTAGRQLGKLYQGGLRVFSGFTANVSDKEILLLTDVISGTLGVFPFGITNATVVSKADSQPNLSADTVRRATENVLELLNNGGTLSARLQYPIAAAGGSNMKSSASVYVQTGLVGPLGDPEHLHGSGAAVAEYLMGLSIRKPDSSAALVGELVVAGRLGYTQALGTAIMPGVDGDRGFGFYQVGVGLQQQGALRLSVLLNHVMSAASKRFVPDVILNLSALR